MFLIGVIDKTDAVEQTIKCHAKGARYMSHRKTPVINDHLDHDFIVLETLQQSGKTTKF